VHCPSAAWIFDRTSSSGIPHSSLRPGLFRILFLVQDYSCLSTEAASRIEIRASLLAFAHLGYPRQSRRGLGGLGGMWAKWDSRISIVRDNLTHFIISFSVPSHLPILSEDSRLRILRESEILSWHQDGCKFTFPAISIEESGGQACAAIFRSNRHVTSQSANGR
jgi:hypothetical protein